MRIVAKEEFMKRALWSLLLILGLVLPLVAQTPKLSPDVLTGTLPDGMTYFVQKNAKPVGRVQLSLIVHAGSVQEREDQRGLAHLLEHVEFDGTEHFGPQAIISFLESNGMKFGADLNANTGFTATQYFLVLPTDKPAVFATGLQILDDWAHGPKIDTAVLENEKKVVLEEGRLRMNNVRGRISNFAVPVLYSGSPYADRLPIGSMDIVRNATAAQVLEFAHTWYRPENMAIIIAGDVDPVAVKQQLLKQFVAPLNPAGKPVVDAPVSPAVNRDGKTFQDKEMTSGEVQWTTVSPAPTDSPESVWHHRLLHQLVYRIINTRLSELTRGPKPPFQDAGLYGRNTFGVWEDTFMVQPYDGKTIEGVEAFARELERARVHGFTSTDVQLAVSELKSQIDTAYTQRGGVTNEDRVDALAEYFLTGIPVEGDEAAHRVGLAQLAAITEPELAQFAASMLQLDAFRLVVLTPDKPQLMPVTVDEVVGALNRVRKEGVEAATERVVKPLLDAPPASGKITSTQTIADLGVTVYELANGAKVMAKKTNFAPGEVKISGQRLGGLSLIDDADYLAVSQAPSVFSQTGLGRLNETQLGDFLSGKQAQVEAKLAATALYVDGSSSSADLETLFQMLHEQLGPVHRDAAAETAWLGQMNNQLANAQDLPATHAQNEAQRLLMNGNVRALPLTTARLAQMNLDRAADLYSRLLADPRGLVISIVGDFDETKLPSLIGSYLASLTSPQNALGTGVRDLGIRPATGPQRSVIAEGTDDKAENTFFLIRPRPFSPNDRFAANILREILDIRLRDVLRNENGGTYDAGSGILLSPYPYAQALVEVEFTCAPARQQELAGKALDVLDAVSRGEFDDVTFQKGLAIETRQVQSYLTQNDFWAGILPEYTLKNYDLSQLGQLQTLYGAVTKAQVAALAKDILPTAQVLQVIFEPKSATATK
jgi:zinc protease